MKFKFRLQALLKHRKNMEDSCLREYRQAQFMVQQALETLNYFYQQIDDSQIQIQEIQRVGGPAAVNLQSYNEYIKGLRLKIEKQKKTLREKQSIAEEKQADWVEASRNVKILIKLEEKQREEFKKEMMAKESKEMNDLVVMRHQRSGV